VLPSVPSSNVPCMVAASVISVLVIQGYLRSIPFLFHGLTTPLLYFHMLEGISAHLSDGILRLMLHGRPSAVLCMSVRAAVKLRHGNLGPSNGIFTDLSCPNIAMQSARLKYHHT
jgi:hypothetical protein